MPGQNLLIRRCFQEAILLSSAMIRHTARSAAVGMRAASAAAASPHQVSEWLAAAESLEAQRRKLSAEYCRLLETHLRRAIAELEAENVAKLSHDALSALARRQAQVDARTEQISVRLQQRVLPLTESRLTVLDSHICSALGLHNVRPDINPFRPEITCNVLAELSLQMGESQELDLWLTYLAPPYAGGLKRLYIDLVQLIRSRGVEDAKFQLELKSSVPLISEAHSSTQPMPLRGTETQAQLPGGRTFSAAQLSSAAVDQLGEAVSADRPAARLKTPFPTMQQLARVFPGVSREAVQAFLYEPGWAAMDAPLPPSFFSALENTVQRFTEAAITAQAPDQSSYRSFHSRRRQQSPVDRSAIALDLKQWLATKEWGKWRSPVARAEQVMALKQKATRISEVMALDSVGVLLEQLAGDTSLLWPVRETFLALSPPLMRLAVVEPWFLANARHPARLFIENVAQKSYEFNDEYSDTFQAFSRPLVAKVQSLQDLEFSKPDDLSLAFALALQQLTATWEEGQAAQGQQQSLKALQFAQSRQSLANQMALSLAQEEVVLLAPEPVAKFILERWSVVLAHAKLADDRQQRDPGGFRMSAMDLVWSLSGAAAVSDPVRAFAFLPPALDKLREGLGLIGATPAEVSATFDMLLPYHSRLLEMRRRKLGREGRAMGDDSGDSAPPLDAVDTPFDAQLLLPKDSRAPWMSESELSAAGIAGRDSGGDPFQAPGAETTLGVLQLAPDSISSDHDGLNFADLAEQLLMRMREGDWFDMLSHGDWQRVQLVWSNDNRSLFMFQSRAGSPHSMTRRICLKLMQSEQLLPVKRRSLRSHQLASVLDSRS